MVALLSLFLNLLISPLKSTSRLEAENAALRQQLVVLQRKMRGRIQFAIGDRLFFILLYRFFPLGGLRHRYNVPLRTCVENPQHRFEHITGRYRLTSRTSIGNMLFRKMLPDALPLFVREPNHSAFIADQQPAVILR